MKEMARRYSDPTIKKLHALSGNNCAAPNCHKGLIASDNETIISKICHIEGASDGGARYNASMTDDERRHFSNLILLCDECHSIVDNKVNELKYPVSLLREWKRNHESKLLYSTLNSKPSLLSIAINAIANINFDESYIDTPESIKAFGIENKITYNAIKRNKVLIDEYKVLYTKISSLYAELELQGSFKKDKLLRNIRQIYLKIKGNYVGDAINPMELIRANADNIIDDVENRLFQSIENNKNECNEDISVGISVIMVDAFMRCKILEDPLKL